MVKWIRIESVKGERIRRNSLKGESRLMKFHISFVKLIFYPEHFYFEE
jgi:hypothetical protein